MPTIDIRVLQRQLALTPTPVKSATLRIQAVDKTGPKTTVTELGVIVSPEISVNLDSTAGPILIPLAPTNGTFCYRWYLWVDGIEFVRHTDAKDVPQVLLFEQLEEIDVDTLQPTTTVVAAWYAIATEVDAARDETITAWTAAETAATAATGSATTATSAKNSASASASSAATAAGEAGIAATAAGQAANGAGVSATAADGSARDAAASALAALQSKNAAATSATDAANSETAAAESASAAGTSSTAAALSATAASEAATTATGAATDATAAKNSAQTSATNADTRAADAASSATAAATSASNADTRATNAAASATAAGTAKSGAETAKAGAETARTGAETAQTGAQTARTGAETARTAAEAARDLALAGQFLGSAIAAGVNLNTITTPGVYKQGTASSATLPLNYPSPSAPGVLYVTTTGAEIMQEYRPQGGAQAGRRGTYIRATTTGGASWDAWRFIPSLRTTPLAGQPAPEVALWGDGTSAEVRLAPVNVPLGTTNLDAVLTDGVYYQDNSANVTAANGYPTKGGAGLLRVSRRNSDSFVVQEYVALSATATQSAQTFIRRRVNGAWAAWQQVQTGYTDTSVGRRLFVNDEVNGRPQMVYGDTGWRDIAGLLINGWTANANQVLLRRHGATVMLKLIGIDRTNATSDAFLNSITGFRNPNGQGWWPYARSDGSISHMREQSGILNLVARTVGAGAQTYATFQWLTDDAWPASLPGNAYGVIPVN